MTKRSTIGFLAALAIAWTAAGARAETLGLGDPAPKLQVKSFVKGEPVKALEPGKNYVVEFWATWCGPCKATIPHLTELQKKHPDVTFIGVSISEHDPSAVEPFVKQMGEKMEYRVAMDSADGAMSKNWMEAAGQNGIPTAFIVNKEGKIAWIGHPMAMEKPLEKVIEGKWDLKTALEEKRKEKEGQAKLQQLASKLQSAQRSGDPKKVMAVLDDIIAERPDLEVQLGAMKLQVLLKLDEQDKALELAKKLEKSPMGEDPNGLNFIAWSIVDPDQRTKAKAPLIKLALELAKKADGKTDHKSAAIADTLGKAYFDSGDTAKAVETAERAVRLAKESGEPVDRGMQDRLEQYRKAAGNK